VFRTLNHAAPNRPLSIDQAHQAMRDHVDCRASRCACKGAAFEVLTVEGRITPDPARSR
jgi:hypothetical protein